MTTASCQRSRQSQVQKDGHDRTRRDVRIVRPRTVSTYRPPRSSAVSIWLQRLGSVGIAIAVLTVAGLMQGFYGMPLWASFVTNLLCVIGTYYLCVRPWTIT